MTGKYSPQIRAERLISAGRIMLAACALAAVSGTSSDSLHVNRPLAYALFGCYVGYALVVAAAVARAPRPLLRTRLATHIVDLAAFAGMHFIEYEESGFFVFFVFSLLSGTLRWQWRGTLLTALAASGIAIVAAPGEASWANQIFESNRPFIRGLYLFVVAVLLGYFGVYGARLRHEISRLAAWSTALPDDAESMMREVLVRIADILSAPRVLLVWEEREEPWLNLALWSGQELQSTREAPDSLTPITAEPLSNLDFFCANADAEAPTVVYAANDTFARWRGVPLHPDLQRRFSIRSVLAVRFQSTNLTGRILWLDKRGMNTDVLALGQLIAGQVSAHVDHFHLLADRSRVAAEEERNRLARDLHDGLLQSLTAMALKLAEVRMLVDRDPGTARRQLQAIDRLITTEQRYLRLFIRHLKPFPAPAPDTSLDARLELLGQRVELQWGLAVHVRSSHVGGPLSAELADELYYLISEAVVNAARHAKASSVDVDLDIGEAGIGLVIVDNGHGFRFRGRYSHGDLKVSRVGPVTLRERVDALQGSLTIESSERGARIEIGIPRHPGKGRR